MERKHKNEQVFIFLLFLSLFFFLCSVTIPQTETLDCIDGLVSMNIENKPLESITTKLSDACKMTILLDEKAKNTNITAVFKSYPVPYAISKILEGTGLNFIIYQNTLSEKSWTLFIGPSRGPGEATSYVPVAPKNENYNSSRSYNPPNYAPPHNPSTGYDNRENPAPAKEFQNAPPDNRQIYAVPNYPPNTAAPTTMKTPERKLDKPPSVPTAGSGSPTSPSVPSKKYEPPDRRRIPPQPPRTTNPQQPPQTQPPTPKIPPPNTGSG